MTDPTAWLRKKDPGFLIVKRAVRATIVMPSIFAVTHFAFSDSQVGLFAAFGSFALLLLVEFTGRPRTRLVSYAGLYVVGSVLIVIGTVVSTEKVAAVVVMGLVGFAVLFTGIVAPQAATASTAALLTFVLPVSVAQPASAVGWRLLGWTLGAICCITATMLLWPPPWHDDLRRRLAAAVSAVARLADARAAQRDDPAARAAVTSELDGLRRQFAGTPYPPTGAAAGAVALSKLVGRVEWVAGNTAMMRDEHWTTERAPARAVTVKVAETLHRAAAVICDRDAHPVDDPERIEGLQQSARDLDELIADALDADVSSVIGADGAAPVPEDGSARQAAVPRATGATGATGAQAPVQARTAGVDVANTAGVDADAGGRPSLAGELDPGFHARAIGIATEMVADAALEAAGAQPVWEHRLGVVEDSTTSVFGHRLLSHLSLRSVWFRNALRGAIGLALAVTVIEITNVQHGFWVVLGTMSVLRSNALGTGATAARAVGGTALGFVVGSLLMVGIANHIYLLWVLLPVAVLIAGTAPYLVSFAAGQAAFTVMVVILFNIIEPIGWRVGLTRIEDVAMGCGVSVVVGFLFWPRGATAALGRALSNAFVASSAYLADAVDRLTMTRRRLDTSQGQQESHQAYLLLDDAFRQFFAERGAKVVSVDTIARLFTGSNRLRIAAYTLATLPVHPPAPGLDELASIEVAEAVLRDSYAQSHRWYEQFAELLADGRKSLPLQPPHDEILHDVLRKAFEDVGEAHRGDRVQTALQMLWCDELLESQNQMQADLLASADLFVRHRGRVLI